MATSPPQSLDQLVKGAPQPNSSAAAVAAGGHDHPPPYTSSLIDTSHDTNERISSLKHPRAPSISDPTSLLPSSPPQIYLNLLILEASLRSQYLTLRARRRQNTFVLTLLSVYLLIFFDLIFLRPREDGKGRGGSQYWLVDMLQKVGFITGVVTALLFWATGQWERGVKWPRRWVGVANRGLRGVNAKIVVIRGPWWREVGEWILFLRPFSGGLWGGEQGGSSYHFINVQQEKHASLDGGAGVAHAGHARRRIVEDGKEYAEEDIAPGGDYIKLLLLPKPFTPDFRQNWEVYRAEYWERENERRAELRKRVKARQREIAREEGGILWWTGWRGWKRARLSPGHRHPTSSDLEKSNSHRRRRPSALSHSSSLTARQSRDILSSHSRSSSRSTTPNPDLTTYLDDARLRPNENRERRWSSSTAGSSAPSSRQNSLRSSGKVMQGSAQTARRPPLVNLGTGSGSGSDTIRGGGGGSGGGSRPGTSESMGRAASGSAEWGSKRASMLSNAESMGDGDIDGEGEDEGRAESA